MKPTILFFLLFCAPVVCNAAMSQAECPEGTIWNSATNACYENPNSPEAKRERRERQRDALEQAKFSEQRRHNIMQEMEDMNRTWAIRDQQRNNLPSAYPYR